MDIVRRVEALRATVSAWRRVGETVALVPTMGALHDGHVSLVTLARRNAQRVVATIFVNPTQFGPSEDLAAYPRDESADVAMLEGAGCDLVYAPDLAAMYPEGFATSVRVSGLSDVLCGAVRAGHFDGVAQVVTKYLNQAQADCAVFGEKDWQQLAIIRRLAIDLDIPTRIFGAPTARAADGLALSSRNRYLTPAERDAAPALHGAISAVAAAVAGGKAVEAAVTAARAQVLAAGFSGIDYLEVRTADRLEAVATYNPAIATRVFAAAWLGKARLIDNVPVPG
jgi:pantoate--beta-alanine ligase